MFQTRSRKGCAICDRANDVGANTKKYPNQWVGLVDVQYQNDDGISVESAVVKYTDKTKSELTRLVLKGEIISRHTNPEGYLQLGMVGVL